MAEFDALVSIANLDETAGFEIDGLAPRDYCGQIAGAGDVNGDGIDDLLIAATGADPHGQASGSTYVIFGTTEGYAADFDLASLDGMNGFRLDGFEIKQYSGGYTGAGDVNNDGFDDFMVYDAKQIYVVYGSKDGFPATSDLSVITGDAGFTIPHGAGLTGDINGDGFDDFFVTDRNSSLGGELSSGSTWVIFGNGGALDPQIDLMALDGSDGFRLDGIGEYDFSSASGSPGDINGDGIDDFTVSATWARAETGQKYTGSTYIVYGKTTPFDPAMSLSDLDGSNGFRFDGTVPGMQLGGSGAGGDINGDGFDDMVIGARGASPGGVDSAGSAFVLFGNPAGFDAIMSDTDINGDNGFRLNGADYGNASGIAGAGDVNGDGFDDVIVIGQRSNLKHHLDWVGSNFIVFGKAGGFDPTIDLSQLDGTDGFRVNGLAAGDQLVGGPACDINGDGFDDLRFGSSWTDSNNQLNAGACYVLFGRAPDAAVVRAGAAGNQTISGGAFADSLSGLGGDDSLEGRGGADSLDGGEGVDFASYIHSAAKVRASLQGAGNTGDAAGDTYIGIEGLEGSRFADRLTGDAQDNHLLGNDGRDVLKGAAGSDVLVGGAKGDSLRGGGNADLFVIEDMGDSRVGIGHDQIADFDAGGATTSVDRLDLHMLDANRKSAGDQGFDFVGTAAFSGAAGELRVELQGSDALLSGDVNGDGAADFEILLRDFGSLDIGNLDSGDFVL